MAVARPRGLAGLGTVPHCQIARHCDSKGGIRNCTERKVNERGARVPEGLKSAFSNPGSIVTGALHSKFGPASKSYFIAKRAVATQHRYGNLNENSIFEYARSHKHEEVTLATLDVTRSIFRRIWQRYFPDHTRRRDRGYRTGCRNRVDILKYIMT
jgi:hypothetical protein